MLNTFRKGFFLIITIFICYTMGYAQVALSSGEDSDVTVIDYSSPKSYEIGGITSSGSSTFDTRMLLFGVGDIIEIPGEKISKSIKRLWNTGMYEEIDITIEKAVENVAFLHVSLVERDRLVSFGFKGSSKSEDTEIREKIKITQGNIVNDNLKKTCSNIILNYYIDKGFHNCTVSVEATPDGKVARGVHLLFNINKGKKVKIQAINIAGNSQVSKATLVKSMKETREKSRFAPFYYGDTVVKHMFKNPEYYRSKDIFEHMGDYFSERVKFRIFKQSKFIENNYENDKASLIARYNELGYRDAHIVKDTIIIKGNDMFINIDVSEGHKYYFRNITFVGNTVHSTDILNQILRIDKGDVYNLARLNMNLTQNENGTDIASLYMNNGYLFFFAHPVEVLIENDSIDVEIRIREGKQARYNKITVSGNTKTNDNVILREITTIPGQMFNRADIMRTQQVLLATGYFNQEKMQVNPVPNEAEGTVDIEYIVEETSSDQFELSAGFGGGGLVLSAGISFNNFSFKRMFKKDAWTPIPSGDGQRVSFRASTNATWYQYYAFSFTEPWLGGKKPNSLSASVYYQRQGSGYSKGDPRRGFLDIIGASVSFGKKLKWPDDYFQLSHTLSYQYYKVQNFGSIFIFDNGFSHNFSYIFAIGRSSVSAPIYPREGSDIMFTVQLTPPYSLFSKKDYASLPLQERYKWLEFHKWKFNISWFTKIVENFVLNVRVKTGFMGTYNKNVGDSPFERFYLGGDGLATYQLDGREVIGMRGYDEGEITPSLGATMYNKLTAELRYPISLNPNATIYLLTFVEAGNAWDNKREYTPFKLYKSAGVGVRIHLPMFGLLGFDWGYGFDPLPGQTKPRGGKFHISINSSID